MIWQAWVLLGFAGGLFIGAPLGLMVLAMVSIHHYRLMYEVVDAAGVYLSTELDNDWCELQDAYKRLMAE